MTEPLNTRLATDGGLVHRVRQPAGPGPHPTVVMVHGRGGDENVMWVFARALPSHWLLVAPRAIASDPDGGYAWHPRKPDEWPALALFDRAVEAIAAFIRALPALYQADLDQVYAMGFSQGAAAAYATALKQRQLVKGIAGLVGFVPVGVDPTPRPLAGLPIFMAVGRTDPTIPLEIAQLCAQTLRAAGAQLDERVYDTGHKLNADGMRDLKDWWARQAGQA